MRLIAGAVLLLLSWAVPSGAGAAEGTDPLYTSQAVITGQDNIPERERGFRETLADVLVRLSADPDAPESPAGAALIAKAGRYVADFDLLDRKKGIQISDEQGTRDRSYILTVRFDRAALKSAMEAAGLPVWEGERPTMAVFLGIDDTVRRYVLSETSRRGYGQRETLHSLSRRLSMPIVIPPEPVPVGFDALVDPDPAALGMLASGLGAQGVLAGTLALGDGGYWTLDWVNLAGSGAEPAAGHLEGVTFDAALRTAMVSAMQAARGSR
jgi:hypothetical protein